MNEFDQFIKHKLKVKFYARYTDDFVIVSDDQNHLRNLLPIIETFLSERLKLRLHPEKISIRTVQKGIDFLGYNVFPHHQLVRTKTKQRIFKKLKARVKEYKSGIIDEEKLKQSLNSFLGVLTHANTFELTEKLKNQFWFWLKE
jgi:hypothetical protein